MNGDVLRLWGYAAGILQAEMGMSVCVSREKSAQRRMAGGKRVLVA
jgi:hypothetical protein